MPSHFLSTVVLQLYSQRLLGLFHESNSASFLVCNSSHGHVGGLSFIYSTWLHLAPTSILLYLRYVIHGTSRDANRSQKTQSTLSVIEARVEP